MSLIAAAICVQTAIVVVIGGVGLQGSLRFILILWATMAVAAAGVAATLSTRT